MNKFAELLEKLTQASTILEEVRHGQSMDCFNSGSCQYCPYKVSIDDIIPIENKSRICLFHLQNTVLLKIMKKLKHLKEINSSYEELLK
jgi:hypothetical protein